MVKELNKVKMLSQIAEPLSAENVTFKDIQLLRLSGKRHIASELLREHAAYMEQERLKDLLKLGVK
jgi:hypothetical protein